MFQTRLQRYLQAGLKSDVALTLTSCGPLPESVLDFLFTLFKTKEVKLIHPKRVLALLATLPLQTLWIVDWVDPPEQLTIFLRDKIIGAWINRFGLPSRKTKLAKYIYDFIASEAPKENLQLTPLQILILSKVVHAFLLRDALRDPNFDLVSSFDQLWRNMYFGKVTQLHNYIVAALLHRDLPPALEKLGIEPINAFEQRMIGLKFNSHEMLALNTPEKQTLLWLKKQKFKSIATTDLSVGELLFIRLSEGDDATVSDILAFDPLQKKLIIGETKTSGGAESIGKALSQLENSLYHLRARLDDLKLPVSLYMFLSRKGVEKIDSDGFLMDIRGRELLRIQELPVKVIYLDQEIGNI